jgi:hypothetical protein
MLTIVVRLQVAELKVLLETEKGLKAKSTEVCISGVVLKDEAVLSAQTFTGLPSVVLATKVKNAL